MEGVFAFFGGDGMIDAGAVFSQLLTTYWWLLPLFVLSLIHA